MNSRGEESTGVEECVRRQVGKMSSRVDALELKVRQVSRFHKSGENCANPIVKGKSKFAAEKMTRDLPRKPVVCPKRMQETKQDEEAQALEKKEMSRKAAMAEITMKTDNELRDIYVQLDDLKEALLRNCRKMTTEEKRKLSSGVSSLFPEDLIKALEIIAQDNPGFQVLSEVDVDVDALSEVTLWRLSFFVKKSLKIAQEKTVAPEISDRTEKKLAIVKALAKTQKRRAKKLT